MHLGEHGVGATAQDDPDRPVHLGEDEVRLRLEDADEVDVDALIAEHDADRPARQLDGPVAVGVAVVAGVLSAWVLVSVFRPRVELQYRMIFLSVVLPLTFLVYRPGVRRRSVPVPERAHDNPGIADWVLAAASVVVCIYPVLDFDAFVVRGPAATATDVAFGMLLVVLVLADVHGDRGHLRHRAGLIGQAPFGEIVLTTVVSALAVVALAVVTGRWMLGPAGPVERAPRR
jgi:TRAP-type uncharacterized transport system fused permease subunit